MAGEEASGQGELGAAHGDGAVAEVVIKHAIDWVFKVAVARQEMSERGVSVTVLSFGGGNHLIARDFWAVTLCSQESLDGAARVSGQRQQAVGDDQSAGIDEWIARDSVLVLELDKGIERGARWLASNPGPDRLAVFLDHQGEREHLRDALDREPPAPVPDAVHFALHRGDGQAERLRIGVSECGYPIGHMSAAERATYGAGHTLQDAFVLRPADR